jgi:hypothetical protein
MSSPAPPPPPPPSPRPSAPAGSDLRRRRDELAEQVAELHWDLGGLTYEMAIRDHFRLDLLVRRAALLQERDAELAEVERLLRLDESASAGSCPSCAAPHSRGALFCWQCGAKLMERSPSTAVPAARDAAAARQDTAAAQRDTAAAQRDAAAAQQGTAGARQDAAGAQRDTAAPQRDAAAAQDTLVMDPVTARE